MCPVEKSFPCEALYSDSGKRYRSIVFWSGLRTATFQALCDGTHTKLQLILQLEHTKRGAKAPLFLSPPHDFPDCDLPPRKTRLSMSSTQKRQAKTGVFRARTSQERLCRIFVARPGCHAVVFCIGVRLAVRGIWGLSRFPRRRSGWWHLSFRTGRPCRQRRAACGVLQSRHCGQQETCVPAWRHHRETLFLLPGWPEVSFYRACR